MQLVMLAAGFGTRFGGLKQLAPVGPNGEALMDYTAAAAKASGFEGGVVVIRPDIEEVMRSHVATYWPAGFSVAFVYQPSIRGTAPAILATRSAINGPFAVTNADDLYGEAAIALIRDHFASSPPDRRHLLVAYHLKNTVLPGSDVKRGICEVNDNDELDRITEYSISVSDTLTFEGSPIGRASEGEASTTTRAISGEEFVSMNLWGFHPRLFDDLDRAGSSYLENDSDGELLIPEVIGDLVASKQESIRVAVTEAQSIGITQPGDLEIVRNQIGSVSLIR